MVSVATVLLHGALYRVQRSLFTHGLTGSDLEVFPRTAVDRAAVSADLRSYLLLIALLCLLYGCIVFSAPRCPSWWERWLLLGVPVGIQVAYLLNPPSLSTDSYSYLAHGYLAAHPPLNPYLDGAGSIASSSYGSLLGRSGWLPWHPQSPYGPLWTHLERLVVQSTVDDVATAQLLIKVPAFVGGLGSAAMIFLLLRELRPSARWVGLVAWLWSPMVIVEFAGDGHIDGLMIFLVLLALYACVRGWTYRCVVALGAAVLVKYVPAVLAAPMVIFLLRRSSPRPGRAPPNLLMGAVTVLAVAALAYAPWWSGVATFRGVRASGTASPGWTPAGLVATQAQAHARPGTETVLTMAVLILAVLITVVLVSRHTRTAQDLVRGTAILGLAVFALLPGGWPWYAALPVALLLVDTTLPARLMVFVLTVCTRATAVFGDLQVLGAVPLEGSVDLDGLVGVSLPALACLLLLPTMWRSGRERGR